MIATIKMKSKCNAGSSQGFTLVELLVCTLILAALVAIIIPLTQEVKIRGQSKVTVSNLRQIGIAAEIYSGDFGRHPRYISLLVTTGYLQADFVHDPLDPYKEGHANYVCAETLRVLEDFPYPKIFFSACPAAHSNRTYLDEEDLQRSTVTTQYPISYIIYGSADGAAPEQIAEYVKSDRLGWAVAYFPPYSPLGTRHDRRDLDAGYYFRLVYDTSVIRRRFNGKDESPMEPFGDGGTGLPR